MRKILISQKELLKIISIIIIGKVIRFLAKNKNRKDSKKQLDVALHISFVVELEVVEKK